MSDFTFSCPNCNQLVQVSSEHAGMEVACPNCQTALVVPVVPPMPGGPETTPRKNKLSVAAPPPGQKPADTAPPPPPVRKKKSKISVEGIGWVVAGILVIGGGILYGPKAWDKYQKNKAEKAAAEEAAKNPPPPPPEPNAGAILKSMGDKYKTFTSYTASGKTTASLNGQSLTSDSAILLSRPEFYRVEWSRPIGNNIARGATWSAGKGHFYSTSGNPLKLRDRETALASAGSASGALDYILADLFFDDEASLLGTFKDYSKTNAETISGQDCYVLTGQLNSKPAEIWINKKNFFVEQTEVFLDGRLDDAAYKSETNSQLKALMLATSKLQGSIKEMYDGIDVNKPYDATVFEKPLPNALTHHP